MEFVTMTDKLLAFERAEDVREWEQLVSGSPWADTYYRAGYVGAYRAEGTKIGALVLSAGSRRFLLPLTFRPLSTLAFAPEASGFDAITPYGYGGVLPLEGGPVSQDEGAQLVSSLQAWCRVEGVVSCFIRLHSLEAQHQWFEKLTVDGVDLQYSGPTKTIELTEWDEAQALPAGLSRGRAKQIRWARRKLSLSVCAGNDPGSEAALQQFTAIYNGTMDRRHASDFYYFSDTYYRELARGLGRNMVIVVARAEEEPVAAAIFFSETNYAHFHLSGSTDEGRRLSASAVVILKGAEWARERGSTRLHLGGGIVPNDSLFAFKEIFGGRTFEFYSLRVIGNRSLYTDLLRRRLDCGGNPLRPNFFPEYRA
jgi:hypothetical protein